MGERGAAEVDRVEPRRERGRFGDPGASEQAVSRRTAAERGDRTGPREHGHRERDQAIEERYAGESTPVTAITTCAPATKVSASSRSAEVGRRASQNDTCLRPRRGAANCMRGSRRRHQTRRRRRRPSSSAARRRESTAAPSAPRRRRPRRRPPGDRAERDLRAREGAMQLPHGITVPRRRDAQHELAG